MLLIVLNGVSGEDIRNIDAFAHAFRQVYEGNWGESGWDTDLKYDAVRGNSPQSTEMIEASYNLCLSWMAIERSPWWTRTESLAELLLSTTIVFMSDTSPVYLALRELPDLNDTAATLDRVTSKPMAFFQQFGCTDGADLLSRWTRLHKSRLRMTLAETLMLARHKRPDSMFAQDAIYSLLGLLAWGSGVAVNYSLSVREAAWMVMAHAVAHNDVSVLTYLARPARPRAAVPPFTLFPDVQARELEFLDELVTGQEVDMAVVGSRIEVNAMTCGVWIKTSAVVCRDRSPLGQLFKIVGGKLDYKEFLALVGVSAKVSADTWDKCKTFVVRAYDEVDAFVEKVSQEEIAMASMVTMADNFGDIKAEMTSYLALRELLAGLDTKLKKLVEQTSLTVCESVGAVGKKKAFVLLIGSSPISSKFTLIDVGLTSETSPIYIAASGSDGSYIRVGVTYKTVGPSSLRLWSNRTRCLI
ncbi:hypothetical protein HK096_001604 [Nowakowskiella sp. JEL0078]|nr:hypothetical protein HK096_001604 [Nowakowskiella sp. JEL0078]